VIVLMAISAPGAALIGAGTAAIINLLGIVAIGLRQDRQRRRELYADALVATLAYREFAYAIPRRRFDEPSAERVRISEAMREVQRDLAYAESLMKIERATAVQKAYARLVAETRRVAGGYIRDAWEQEPITEDKHMNVAGGLDFSAIAASETAYLAAVRNDLAWYRIRGWSRNSRQPLRRQR
jgi:hypothetical protein